jgi:hypothetical protein
MRDPPVACNLSRRPSTWSNCFMVLVFASTSAHRTCACE